MPCIQFDEEIQALSFCYGKNPFMAIATEQHVGWGKFESGAIKDFEAQQVSSTPSGCVARASGEIVICLASGEICSIKKNRGDLTTSRVTDEPLLCIEEIQWGNCKAIAVGDLLGYVHIVDYKLQPIAEPLRISTDPVQCICSLQEGIFCFATSGGEGEAELAIYNGAIKQAIARHRTPFSVISMDSLLYKSNRILLTLGFMGEVGLVDISNRKRNWMLQDSPHEHGVPHAVSCSHDGRHAITVGSEGNLVFWTIRSEV
ncbi:WD40 repeat domain-containing protein [Thalassoroseus pseudoceratinae]|uniref:WD40 repeat domain-containing protein n=1 Tax=Thalassoroseus pseudoceratinae TaxID=2713176 RepID=UPI001422025E|nr:WD40 repeat domain-containing protein [Thalassoroseus pseudoceratinae]